MITLACFEVVAPLRMRSESHSVTATLWIIEKYDNLHSWDIILPLKRCLKWRSLYGSVAWKAWYHFDVIFQLNHVLSCPIWRCKHFALLDRLVPVKPKSLRELNPWLWVEFCLSFCNSDRIILQNRTRPIFNVRWCDIDLLNARVDWVDFV